MASPMGLCSNDNLEKLRSNCGCTGSFCKAWKEKRNSKLRGFPKLHFNIYTQDTDGTIEEYT